MLILRVVAGSRLYGTFRPDSDYDWYEVYDKIRSNQCKRDNQDVIKVGLSRWLELCASGSHQALDAMFAPDEFTEVDLFREYRHSYRVRTQEAVDRLVRTAKNIPDKHKPRLQRYIKEVLEDGRYNPTGN